MKILGIESSADETAAAVVEDGSKLLSSVVASSLDQHIPYGGIVPEIASRSHLEVIIPVIDQALQDAIVASNQSSVLSKKSRRLATGDWRLQFDPWDQIDAIAVTQGPGLLGSLLIGVLTARTLAIAKNKQLIPVNHVEAHVYAAFLGEKKPKFPLLSLIVSGGHTSLVLFQNHNKYKVLGQTYDDAAGEAFDKVAKMLGLPYPGGPSIAKAAQAGNPEAIKLPEAKMANKYDFSFSGLKTAVLRAAQNLIGQTYDFPSHKLAGALNEAQKADIAASFQRTAVNTLVNALKKAEAEFKPKSIVIAGGVAANEELREAAQSLSTSVTFPPDELCGDNAAMVASRAYYSGKPADPFTLEADPSLRM